MIKVTPSRDYIHNYTHASLCGFAPLERDVINGDNCS